MTETNFDVIVIGGGPGGYVAAIRARQLGLSTAIVEREHLGGICLNWGCIPTKALLRTAEVYHLMKNADDFGLKADRISFDLAAIVKRSRNVAGQLNSGVTHLMKKNKVTVFEGTAKITKPNTVAVDGKDKSTKTITGSHIIVATGARARELPHLKADGERIWTYRHAMVPKELPSKLLVIGSGAIGIEFASFYNEMGSEVTVVEMLDRLLPVEDEDISSFAAKSFQKQGMRLLTSSSVTSLKPTSKGISATIKDEKGKESSEDYSHVILAIGITGNCENLGLEELGVAIDKGHIKTDGYGYTGVPGVWAIGDITGAPWLAHKASHEGIIAVEKLAKQPNVHPIDKSNIPGCTYCRPQIASVGMTEKQAKDAGHSVKVGKFPFIGNGKAIALGEADGLIKTVFDEKTGELLGAHMVGAEVTELIQGYVIGRALETTEAELMHTIFAHPTLSEMMHESVLDAYGRAVHM